MSPQLRVGCSGWQYRHWRGAFYPPDLPAAKWLQHYVRIFDTVEVNSTFYRLPEAATFAAWRSQMPASFSAAIKASRFITHMKRLTQPGEPLARLVRHASALGPRLGPILYQLPASMRLDLPRLDQFLARLPRRLPPDPRRGQHRTTGRGRGEKSGRVIRHAIEFRHPSWYVPEVFDRLDAQRVALCLHDRAGAEVADVRAGPFVYVRFHGASGAYHGAYSDVQLDRWADRLAADYRAGRDVYAYFNNDPAAAAPRNALTLRALLRRRVGLTA